MNEVLLKNKEKFKTILENYHVSEHALKVLNSVEYVVLIGPAGAGRNTIINELVSQFNFHQIISDTTRPPKFRDGKMEVDGINYFFRSEDGMLEDLENGEFLEAELIHNQQVSGTSIRELEKAALNNTTAINEVEYGGAKNILSAKPDTLVIAIFPPSFEEWQTRFSAREKITNVELKNRLRTALKVIETIKEENRIQIVLNDNYKLASVRIKELADLYKSTPEIRKEVPQEVLKYEEKIIEYLKTL